MPFWHANAVSHTEYTILYNLALSTVGIYGIIIAGWASQSRYPLLGSVRATAQMISYEISFSVLVIIVAVLTSTLNLSQISLQQLIVGHNFFPAFVTAVIFFVTILA